MIRNAYWSGLALILLALIAVTGCSTNVATAPPTQIVTVAAGTCTAVDSCMGPFQQNAPINTAFASTLSATVFSNGTPVAGATVTFTAPSGSAGGTFGGNSFATGTTNASGVATSPVFTANGTVGTYVVIASSASSQSTGLFSMANTELPSAISIAGGNPQSTTEGTQFANALSVTVLDAASLPLGAQFPVTFTAPDGTFQDTGTNTTVALTNASGVATAAPYTASSAVSGTTPYSVTATATEGANTYTITFTLSNTIMPAVISPVAGSTPQSTTSGTPFANLLAVTVVDATTPVPNPVVGAYVTFTAPSFTLNSSNVPSASSGLFWDSGTSTYDLPSVSVWTDSSGTATPPAFEANALPGTYTVTASVVVKSGTTLSTNNETPTQNFALTNQ